MEGGGGAGVMEAAFPSNMLLMTLPTQTISCFSPGSKSSLQSGLILTFIVFFFPHTVQLLVAMVRNSSSLLMSINQRLRFS